MATWPVLQEIDMSNAPGILRNPEEWQRARVDLTRPLPVGMPDLQTVLSRMQLGGAPPSWKILDADMGSPVQVTAPRLPPEEPAAAPSQGRDWSKVPWDALMAAGFSMLANNQGNYGAAGPAIGKGGLAGLQVYRENQQRDLNEKYRKSQMESDSALRAIQMKRYELENKKAEKEFSEADRKKSDIESFIAANPPKDPTEALLLKIDPDSFVRLRVEQIKQEGKEGGAPKTMPGAPYYQWDPAAQKFVFNKEVYDRVLQADRAKGTNISFGQPVAAVDPVTGEQKLVQVNPQGQIKDTGLAPVSSTAKMPAEIQRQQNALGALQKTLDAYEQAMRGIDPRGLDQLDPEKRAQIEAILADATVNYKEAAALGALTGPDVGLLDRALTNPLSVKGAFYGKGGIARQIQEARNAIVRRQESITGGMSNKAAGAGVELPKEARMQLKEGEVTTFTNGQSWMLKGGKPVRVK